ISRKEQPATARINRTPTGDRARPLNRGGSCPERRSHFCASPGRGAYVSRVAAEGGAIGAGAEFSRSAAERGRVPFGGIEIGRLCWAAIFRPHDKRRGSGVSV